MGSTAQVLDGCGIRDQASKGAALPLHDDASGLDGVHPGVDVASPVQSPPSGGSFTQLTKSRMRGAEKPAKPKGPGDSASDIAKLAATPVNAKAPAGVTTSLMRPVVTCPVRTYAPTATASEILKLAAKPVRANAPTVTASLNLNELETPDSRSAPTFSASATVKVAGCPLSGNTPGAPRMACATL